jgi:translation elongation factor EF-G
MNIRVGRWYKIKFTTGEDWAYILILSETGPIIGYIRIPVKDAVLYGWMTSVGQEDSDFLQSSKTRLMAASFKPKVRMTWGIMHKAIRIIFK